MTHHETSPTRLPGTTTEPIIASALLVEPTLSDQFAGLVLDPTIQQTRQKIVV